MKTESNIIGDVPVLRVDGRFDAYEAEAVKSWLDAYLEQGSGQLVINLHGVNFIDSTGLATLVHGMKQARELEGDLHLANLPQTVRIIFELTRLDKAFQIFVTEEEAAAAFTSK